MTLGRTVVVPGMLEEYTAFAALLRSLGTEQWETPSRCEAWTVANVAGHVVGQLSDVSQLHLEGLGTPEVTGRQVQERRGRSPGALADELDTAAETASALAAAFDDDAWSAPGPPGTPGTLGQGLESLWFDTYLHGDDIRAAIDQPTVTGEGVLASVSHIAQILTDLDWRRHVAMVREWQLDLFYQRIARRLGEPSCQAPSRSDPIVTWAAGHRRIRQDAPGPVTVDQQAAERREHPEGDRDQAQ